MPRNEPGELCSAACRSSSKIPPRPGATAAVVDADGWFHTSDLAARTTTAASRSAGRLKDMLKVGGENVSAAEIEGVIAELPAVVIVQVVGAPDARYVEVAAAFVQLRPGLEATEQEIIDACVGGSPTSRCPATCGSCPSGRCPGPRSRSTCCGNRSRPSCASAASARRRGSTPAPEQPAQPASWATTNSRSPREASDGTHSTSADGSARQSPGSLVTSSSGRADVEAGQLGSEARVDAAAEREMGVGGTAMSTASGSTNRAGSPLAAASRMRTRSPAAICRRRR